MNLRTTTWKERNIKKLRDLKEEVIKRNILHPIIADIGPGGIVDFLSGYFPKGDSKHWDYSTKTKKFLLHLFESGLRKTGLFNLRSYEVEEVMEIFKDLSPLEVYVIDNQPKVLEIVKSRLNGNITIFNLDITHHSFPYKSDITICYNTIQRTNDPRNSLENVLKSVRKGGLLSTDFKDENLNPESYEGFRKIKDFLYLREY